MPETTADLVLHGFSPGCIAAGLTARAQGLSVMMVDERPLSLTDLRRPFVARLHRLILAEILAAQGSPPDAASAEALVSLARRHVVGRVSALQRRLSRASVPIVQEPIRSLSEKTITLRSGERIRYDRLVIADSALPRRPRRFVFDESAIVDSAGVFRRRRLPRTCVVLGAEGVGVELASLLANLGVRVTLVDRRSRMMRAVDWAIADTLKDAMSRDGIDIVLQEEVVHCDVERNGAVRVGLGSGRLEVADCIVVAAGVTAPPIQHLARSLSLIPNSEGFLHATPGGDCGVASVSAGGGATGVDHGIGAEWGWGRAVAESGRGAVVPGWIASMWSTVPAVGSIGLTEEAYAQLGVRCFSGLARHRDALFGPSGRRPFGCVKILVTEDGAVAGLQAIGEKVPEILDLAAKTMQREETIFQLAARPWQEGSVGEVVAHAAAEALLALSWSRLDPGREVAMP